MRTVGIILERERERKKKTEVGSHPFDPMVLELDIRLW